MITLSIFFIASFIYAIVRYVVYSGVDAVHIPLYITNKAISLTAVFALVLSYGIPFSASMYRRYFGIAGFGLVVMHLLMSFALLNPQYYSKFFGNNQSFNLTGELTLLMGILAFCALIFPVLASFKQFSIYTTQLMFRFTDAAMLFIALHATVMGFKSWIKPMDYPGYMPPISLLATLLIVCIFTLKIIERIKQRQIKNTNFNTHKTN